MDKNLSNASRIRVKDGDAAVCSKCGHAALFSHEVIRELVEKHFVRRAFYELYQSDLARFKCSRCGAKDAGLSQGERFSRKLISAAVAGQSSACGDDAWRSEVGHGGWTAGYDY